MIGTVEAPHRIWLAVSRRTSERTFYDATFRGEHLVTSRDPEFAACRALLARGFTGELRTRWVGARHDAMVLDIEHAARRSTFDSRNVGPVLGRFREFSSIKTEADADSECPNHAHCFDLHTIL